MASNSAKLLANQLTNLLGKKVRRIKHGGNYLPRLHHSIIINYGSSIIPWWQSDFAHRSLNNPVSVALGSNKLSAFNCFSQDNLATPEWTTSREVAEEWIRDNSIVVCRTLLNAHGGKGIFLASLNIPIIPAPVYVKYKKKRKEFRVHVFQNQVIDVVEKRKIGLERRQAGTITINEHIRNHSNGWVFCRDNLVEPMDLRPLAINAVNCLKLDFGAVDIIWNEFENKCYLLEVNTAPGLEGTTLIKYVAAIYNWQRNI